MKQKLHLISFLLIACLLAGCLPKYYPIYPELGNYSEAGMSNTKTSITIGDSSFYSNSYKEKKELLFVPVKIENNDTVPFLFNSETVTVFNNFEPVQILSHNDYYRKIKKKTTWYYIAGLIVLPTYSSGDGFDVHRRTWPITLGAAGYIYKAYKANHQLKEDINQYDLYNKTILPGETVYGFICINTRERKELAIRIN